MKRKIKVMLVEDNPEYRDVIAFAFRDDPDIELDSQYGTAEIALRSLQDMSTRSEPDLILLDLNLPGLSGIEALSYFRKSLPDTKIIILTQSNNEEDILNAISAGASGYLLKSARVKQVKEGIQTVRSGGAALDARVAEFILKTLKGRPKEAELEKTLSDRELEILTLLSEGLVKKEICTRLKLSYPTVDTHVRHIYEKLEVQNAPAAVNRAHRLGLFSNEKN